MCYAAKPCSRREIRPPQLPTYLAPSISRPTISPQTVECSRGPLESAGTQAALTLTRREREVTRLCEAITVLRAAGYRQLASASVCDDTVQGWAVWQAGASLDLTVAYGPGTLKALIEPDPSHPLARFGRAASFKLHRPRSSVPQTIEISIDSEVIYATRAPANEPRRPDKPRHKSFAQASRGHRPIAVVVPVFGDLESTRVCLDSLLSALPATGNHRIIVVDDASPDAGISSYLRAFATNGSVLLLRNAKNMGFIGSVNRALEQTWNDDVILLNSDTIVPVGFAARLAEAAQSSSDIGTVTPLSNNGEYTSFPVANRANPLASPDEVKTIDTIAARVNADHIIDIPNGIGFCLYITRSCLDAVGILSEDYDRGYLEDVDFCLRARACGFRNVCLPSVYIGHAGAKSFGQNKRALVVRNLNVLDHRFPSYRAESAAFVSADPLRPARAAIERGGYIVQGHPRLLLTGNGAISAVAMARSRQLLSENQAVVIVEFWNQADGRRARMFDPAGGVPQSLEFALSSADDCDAMVDYVRGIRPSTIEIVDPSGIPVDIMDRVLALHIPHDIFIADAALFGAYRVPVAVAQSLAGTSRRTRDNSSDNECEATTFSRWLNIAQTAKRILLPSQQALACIPSSFPADRLEQIGSNGETRKRRSRRRRQQTGLHLGLLPVRSCGEEQVLIGAIARTMRLANPEVSITVIGSTPNDLHLMQIDNTFVTGPIEPVDLDWVTQSYGPLALFLASTRPIFGHPITEFVFKSAIPVAFFDWSAGQLKPRKRDLALAPGTSLIQMTTLVRRWLSKL